jgi:hypothetical protein
MKSLANGIILQSNTVTATECLHYALNLPTSVVISGVKSQEKLEQAFTVARTFRPMSDTQVQALLAKSAQGHRTARSSCPRRRQSSMVPPSIRSGWARSPCGCSR